MSNLFRWTMVLVALGVWGVPALPALASSTIPFVGCPGTDMEGPIDPPSGQPITVDMPAAAAAKLALYVGHGLGFLAPRGWKCGGDWGSAIGSLWASPQTGDTDTGPVIVMMAGSAETEPGVSFVRRYCSQYFQKICSKSDFLKSAQQQGSLIEGESLVPRFDTDTLNYTSDSQLQYRTPADHRGLGTEILNATRYSPNDLSTLSRLPTDGLIEMINDPGPAYLIDLMAIRVSSDSNYLIPFIVKFEMSCPPFDGNLPCDQIDFQENNQ